MHIMNLSHIITVDIIRQHLLVSTPTLGTYIPELTPPIDCRVTCLQGRKPSEERDRLLQGTHIRLT